MRFDNFMIWGFKEQYETSVGPVEYFDTVALASCNVVLEVTTMVYAMRSQKLRAAIL